MDGLHKLGSLEDTIVAVSTPYGRSGIGVVRISGSRSRSILEEIFRSTRSPEDRRARYGTILTTEEECLDRVVATIFEGPHSYTGEDVAEISAHGNPLILNKITVLALAAGARRASPGEFTLRAVANAKMNLAEAEAVRDFIDAQTESQARAAMLQMNGALATKVRPGTEALVDVIAELEAGIDFAEDDVDVPESATIAERVDEIGLPISEVVETFDYGRLLSGGFCLAIIGKPNVGKSSIFNRMVSYDRAIVTDVPGTTRDVLTETVELGGLPIRFADTAGVREVADRLEAMGVTRTIETLAQSDLVLVVVDSSEDLDDDDRAVLARAAPLPHLVVANKVDLPVRWESLNGSPAVRVSALTGAGIEDLRAAICDHISKRRPADAESFVLTSARQKEALEKALAKLRAASTSLRAGVPHEMVLLDLYAALSAIGEVTGEVVTDDILGRIFSTFCIGK